MTSDEIRRIFLKFFENKGHKTIPSASLIPHGDPTLLLTTAGMVQMKPYFLGLEKAPSLRLTSCQKCFRTTDIDAVGDIKHLTFFEMLGSFSVGDYFKKETISWAWEFVTQYLKLPEERLWITIYLDDDESFAFWQQVGVPVERILRFGEEDNFWGPAGDSGPCGPCSEIHYDMGEELGCGRPECKPNCECGRFSEIWNLVFTQYNQSSDGSRTSLPRPNIDTGMGLERITAAVQGKPSVYETDLFSPVVQRICQLAGKRCGENGSDDRAIRIIAEHGRGITFLIADGVLPSNEGRGYVLRRLLRRTSLFGRRLNLDKPFLNEVAELVIDNMSHIYPELATNRGLIKEVIKAEEERFINTLDSGLDSINATLERTIEGVHKFVSSPEYLQAFQQMQESVQSVAERMGKAMQATQEIKLSPGYLQTFQQVQESVQSVAERMGKAMQATQEIKLSPGYLQAFQQMQESVQSVAERMGKAMQATQEIKLSPGYLQAFQQMQESLQSVAERMGRAIQPIQEIGTISGREVFKFHDTHGFPKELTAEIARERGLSIDFDGFEVEMEKQRKRARATQKFASDIRYSKEKAEVEYESKPTEFIGYEMTVSQSKVLELKVGEQSRRSVSEGNEVDAILNQSPFYGEMGGQAGDTGEVSSGKGKIVITGTVRSPADVIIHQGKVSVGEISVGDEVEARVDVAHRLDIARNHTATHLLQAALKQTLGNSVSQRGSLVESNRLRFDFSWQAAITEGQLMEIQRWVNEKVRQNLPVKTKILPYKQAIAEGAIALFEEKYGEEVRVVEIGEPPISKELCGGTHVKSTGEIGFFLITSETSIGTGLRRIEAVTGRAVELLFEKRLSALQDVAREIGSSLEEVPDKVRALTNELEVEHKRSLLLERELSREIAESLLKRAEQIDGVTVLAAKVPSLSMAILREMGDILRDKLKSAVVVLATIYNGKPNFLAMVTPDLVAKGFNAGDIIKQVAKVTGGGGGGKATMAQAGGRDASKLDEALRLVRTVIASRQV